MTQAETLESLGSDYPPGGITITSIAKGYKELGTRLTKMFLRIIHTYNTMWWYMHYFVHHCDPMNLLLSLCSVLVVLLFPGVSWT